MRSRRFLTVLRWSSLVFFFGAVLLAVVGLVVFSRLRANFPPGMVIADVSVGGLNQQQAAERLIQAYGVPIEVRYEDSLIQIKPSTIGFELDLQSMLTAADIQRIRQPFWPAFWDYLWNRLPTPSSVPLSATISEERLKNYLRDEVALRYDRPPSPVMPVAGTTNFDSGDSGRILDLDRAVLLIKDAMRSPNSRVVNLSFKQVTPTRPSIQNLQIMMQQIIDVSGFDGLTEVYMLDLQTREELNFAYQQGETIPPGIAFTAASTMKIPIMASVYRRIAEPAPDDISNLIKLMIERSENDPADTMMERVMDENLGPLQVTDDLQKLGLENTFLAGYFRLGAPLLRRFDTPANTRTDYNTGPDPYNQTTPADMGMILDDLYQCSKEGGGTFAVVFPGEISMTECRAMIDHLASNQIGVLMQAGLPEGTRVANKHGWIVESDGLLHTFGDAGLVYTPGGDFVLVIFMNQPTQLVFDPANTLLANLARSVYNYFNIPAQ